MSTLYYGDDQKNMREYIKSETALLKDEPDEVSCRFADQFKETSCRFAALFAEKLRFSG